MNMYEMYVFTYIFIYSKTSLEYTLGVAKIYVCYVQGMLKNLFDVKY